MANELTINASLVYSDTEGTKAALSLVDKVVNVTTKLVAGIKQNVGTSEEALKLGDLSSLGFVLLINRDLTNYIELKTATSGTVIAKMFPGECCMFRFGSGITAPFVVANTATCQMDILLINA